MYPKTSQPLREGTRKKMAVMRAAAESGGPEDAGKASQWAQSQSWGPKADGGHSRWRELPERRLGGREAPAWSENSRALPRGRAEVQEAAWGLGSSHSFPAPSASVYSPAPGC